LHAKRKQNELLHSHPFQRDATLVSEAIAEASSCRIFRSYTRSGDAPVTPSTDENSAIEQIERCCFSSVCVFDFAQGIFISRVAEDGPSAVAGLRAGDRLLSVGEQYIQ
jgi:S1-C subfamily serine protease